MLIIKRLAKSYCITLAFCYYLGMNLKTYIETYGTDAARKVAKAAGTNYAYLSQVAHGHRKAGALLTQKISQSTGNIVQLHEIRPDIYQPSEQGAA